MNTVTVDKNTVTVDKNTSLSVETEVLMNEKLLTYNPKSAYLNVFWTVLGAIIAWIIALLISSKNIKAGYYDNVAIAKSSWIPNSSTLLLIWLLAILFYGYASGHTYTADSTYVRKVTLSLFVVQLVLTILWFYFFFNTLNYQAAGIIAIIMLILVIAQSVYALKSDRTAGFITILYAVWILIITVISWQLYTNTVTPRVTY